MLNNLLTNAIKYNREGGSVHVTLGRHEDIFEIAVRDTGFGLSRDDAAKLFNDFVRIKNAKTRGIEGSGLGLATVKRIAGLYSGDAIVSSEPDQGSTFTVTLKAALPEKERQAMTDHRIVGIHITDRAIHAGRRADDPEQVRQEHPHASRSARRARGFGFAQCAHSRRGDR